MDQEHISNHLQTVTDKKELQKQESKKQKSGDIVLFEKALSSCLIASSQVEQIKQVLRLIMVKIGLRAQNWPSDEEKIILISHIVENYGGNRIEEIQLAFEMAMAGKLDLKTDDVKCYENFSCAYFSSIMNAYRNWVVQEVRQLENNVVHEQKIFTQEENENAARESVEMQYQLFLSGNDLKFPETNREVLVKDKLINEGETVFEFFKRKVVAGQLNIYVKG